MRYHPFDFDQFLQGPAEVLGTDDDDLDTYEPTETMPPLLQSPYLTNLRALKVGFSDDGERIRHSTMVNPFGGCNAQQVIDLLAKCPRLEELYLNTHLPGVENLFASPQLGNVRVLQYYYGTPYGSRSSWDNPGSAYPLTALARNPALKRLTTLRLHPGRDGQVDLEEMAAVLRSPRLPSLTHLQVHMTAFGDEGCRPIIGSGTLRRLKVLDIGYGNMTDEGARQLAACPDLKRLDVLNVSRNALTAEGVAALRATGVQVVADNQHDPEERDYFYEVDAE
jgi:hypothetical protein